MSDEVNWITNEAFDQINSNEADYLISLKICKQYPVKSIAAQKMAEEFSNLSGLTYDELIDWEMIVAWTRDSDEDEDYLSEIFPEERIAYDVINRTDNDMNSKSFLDFLEKLSLISDGEIG